MVVDSLCQAYHWSLEDVLKLTMPQIVMMNHAATVNYERFEKRRKAKASADSAQPSAPVEELDPVVANGKRISELNTDEFVAWFTS